MSSTAMYHNIKLHLKFIGCIAYRCGYAQAFINQKLTKIWKRNYFTE